jgi:nitrate reductase gamma subunit
MDRLFAEVIAAVVCGMVAIFTVALILLRRWRNRQLTRASRHLDETLNADAYQRAGK